MATFNNKDGYGWVARVLHWGMALAVVAMFGLGVWMRSLGYYDPWYTRAPDIHRSVGIVLLALLVLRLVWKLMNRDTVGSPSWALRASRGTNNPLAVLRIATGADARGILHLNRGWATDLRIRAH